MKNTAKKIEKLSGISLLLFLTAAILIIIFSGVDCGSAAQNEETETTASASDGTLSRDPNAKSGTPKEKTHEEIVKELNEAVNASKVTVTVNSNPQLDKNTKIANLNIVNAEGNPYAQQAEIKYENATIYKSGLIPVGSYIENATLDVDLPVGSYKCTVYVNSISADGSIVGTVAAKIRLDVCENV